MKLINELRKMSDVELAKELKEAQDNLFKLRFKKVIDEMNDKSQIKKSKRKIARIKTILSQRVSSEKS